MLSLGPENEKAAEREFAAPPHVCSQNWESSDASAHHPPQGKGIIFLGIYKHLSIYREHHGFPDQAEVLLRQVYLRSQVVSVVDLNHTEKSH